MNTLNMALDSTKHHAKLSHVGRVQDRAMVAAECLASGREYFEAQRVAFTPVWTATRQWLRGKLAALLLSRLRQ